jgi:ABC-type sugar transport system ATPase subunit
MRGRDDCAGSGCAKFGSRRLVKASKAIRPCGTYPSRRSKAKCTDRGIRTVQQEPTLLPHLSVAENVLLGQMPHRARLPWVIDWDRAFMRTEAVLNNFGFPGIDVRAPVSRLSVSVRQIVGIATAIASTPQMLILDEATSVLSAAETDLLFRKVRELTQAGSIVIYISHRLEEIFRLSHRITVLKDGSNVLTRPTRDATMAEVITAMVGRTLAEIYPVREARHGSVVLEVCDLTGAGTYQNISFSLRAGEVVGMYGLVGSGRTEVARAIFGAEPAIAGEIKVDGQRVKIGKPADAIRNGIILLTEDRKRDGLALACNVLDNASMASMHQVAPHGVLHRRMQERVVGEKVDQLSVWPRGVDRLVAQLSGGNQQKVVLAKWLLLNGVRVFILDEPTRGVDIGTRADIYRMINELSQSGAAVLLISSEMEEATGMSDRLLVMRQGRIVAELRQNDFAPETVFGYAAGVKPLQAATQEKEVA